MSHRADVVIVGAGIVGLATGYALLERHPRLKLVILEKEDEIATHQTGHNSGVIHAGIYYRPGSLKARLCVEGRQRLRAFCDEHGVEYELCGKVIVATDEREAAVLEELYRRGVANGVEGLRKIGPEELREIEPHAAGVAALHSPQTGIIDFRRVAGVLAARLRDAGAELWTGAALEAIQVQGARLGLVTRRGDLEARFLINCAGLYADRVARLAGAEPGLAIIPFRGEYYWIVPERRDLVRGLIYPVPDPRFPFLGVHFTRTIHGGVEAGPNAVLAFAREGYTRQTVRWDELRETLAFPGFWALARRYWRVGLYEFYRSLCKSAFVRSLQRLVPEIRAEDLEEGGAGVRAQAVSRDGRLLDDFCIVDSEHAIHVLNAPSPAATSSLAIGHYIVDQVAARFALAG